MGKKRRLIKKKTKFSSKHSSHPISKHLQATNQTEEVTPQIENVILEKIETKIEDIKVKKEITIKKVVDKKNTSKPKVKNTTTQRRVKKTKRTTDKGI